MEYDTKNLEETKQAAAHIIETISGHSVSGNRATVVALYGDLGAGKTSFVQGAAQALGIEESVPSPTFIIERVYRLSDQKWKRFVHIDCYRLESPEELHAIGWDELVQDKDTILFVEWADKIEAVIPPDTLKIYFEQISETMRKITYDENHA